MKMKKKLAIFMAAVMTALTLAACGSTAATPAPADPAQSEAPADPAISADPVATPVDSGSATMDLAVTIGPNPETMDPSLNSASDASSMILHAFECLLVKDANEQLQPGAAIARPEVSEDRLTYTFTLRDGLKWSDGQPLTAADFEWSWKHAVASATAAPYAEIFNVIAGFPEANDGDGSALQVTATDDKTLVVTLAAPCAYFEDLAAFPTFSPIRKDIVEANGDAWATAPETYIGNGSFMVTEWVPSEYILMAKNPNYWDAANIKLDTLKFVLIEDDNAALTAYENGEILLTKSLPSNEIPTLRDTRTDEFHLDPLQGTYYLSLNNNVEPLNDPRVRRALSLAIDREYIANTVMQGTYTPGGNFVGPGITDADTTKQFMDVAQSLNDGNLYFPLTPDVETAKQLMADAGYADGFTMSYMTNDAAYHRPVAEALQQMWAELNVTLNIEIMEWQSVTASRRNGDYESARNGWINDYNDPSSLLDLLVSTNGNNDGKYNNPAYDELMEKARITDDQTARMGYMHEAEKMAMEDSAAMPVAYYAEFYMRNPKLEGFYHSSLGYFYFMDCTIAQ